MLREQRAIWNFVCGIAINEFYYQWKRFYQCGFFLMRRMPVVKCRNWPQALSKCVCHEKKTHQKLTPLLVSRVRWTFVCENMSTLPLYAAEWCSQRHMCRRFRFVIRQIMSTKMIVDKKTDENVIPTLTQYPNYTQTHSQTMDIRFLLAAHLNIYCIK